MTNPGKAEDYQGWNLVDNPAVYKGRHCPGDTLSRSDGMFGASTL